MSESDGFAFNERISGLQKKRLYQLRTVIFGAYLALTGVVAAQACEDTTPAAVKAATAPAQPLEAEALPPTTNTTLAVTATSYSSGVTPFASMIEQAASSFSVDSCLLGAITERESGGQVYVEYGGTHGLMQLDLKTAQYMTNMYDIEYNGDIYDPQTQFNIGASIISRAEEVTGIDTNNRLDPESLRRIGIFYHGEGFYQTYMQGGQLPPQVPEADRRLQQNYAQFC